MTEENQNSPNSPELGIYKQEQYDAFITALKGDYLYNWTALAGKLGVDRKTLYNWRQTAQAQDVINAEIKRLLAEMETAGKDDWRMYREKAKILGVDDIQKIEVSGDVGQILDKLESNYDEFGRTAKEQMVANEPPIQD